MYKKMTKAERRIRLIGVKIGILKEMLGFNLGCLVLFLAWSGLIWGDIETDASVGDGTGSSKMTS